MLIDKTDGKLDEIKDFIEKNPHFEESFGKCMEQLRRINENYPEYDCLLMKDFAPYSLEFVFQNKTDPSDFFLRGGLIYHGNPDESLSVQLVPSKGFSIHT